MTGVTRKVNAEQLDLLNGYVNSFGIGELSYLDKMVIGDTSSGETKEATVQQVADLILTAVTGSVIYQGTWNASTDTPSLPTAAVGNKGHYYVVSTAGTYSGTDYYIGDWVISNGSSWQRVDAGPAGEVIGPASATDNAIARFDGTTGKLVQNSVITASDTGDVSGVVKLSLDNAAYTPKTTPPTSPVHGQTYFDDDYDALMYYDSVRAKWLTVDSITVAFASDGNISVGAAFNLFGGPASTATPWPVLNDPVTVTKISVQTNVADTETWTLGLADYSTGATLSASTYSISATNNYSNNTVDKTFSVGQAIMAYVSASSSGQINHTAVTLTVRRYK